MNTYANEIPATIYEQAHAAGMAAGNGCTPTPMVVGQPTTPLGNDIDYSKETYYVSDGVCGFAWINIKPARGKFCLLYTSPSPRDATLSRMPSSA